MRKSLNQYRDIVGDKIIDEIYGEAAPLTEKHVVHINSTHYGGGVVEILNSIVPLMNDLGISTGWRVLKGSPEFFTVTKKFHNALQGDKINLSRMKKKVYMDFNENNSFITHISHHDCIIIHDIQPLPFIQFYKKRQPWIWRCHIDLSKPNEEIWNYIKKFILRYDGMIVSAKKFKKQLPIFTSVIQPSIDPLTPKNQEVSEKKIQSFLSKKGVDLDKPIISQVSRFDKWKDPLGVIKVFELVKKKVDCRLVLMGNMAADDPEGPKIFQKVVKKVNNRKDIILITEDNDFLVNVLQRASSVVLQKSVKEGFGLTVSEALWKETPVVGSNVGGIPLQIINGKTGFLCSSVKSYAKKTVELIKNEKLNKKIGKQGKKFVKENFLVTRHLMDYLKLLKRKEIGLIH